MEMKQIPKRIWHWLFKREPVKNKYCECETDCGAKIYYTNTGIGKKWCPTVTKRLMEPFRQFPWNQVGVNGQVLSIDEKNGTWELLDNSKNVISYGTVS